MTKEKWAWHFWSTILFLILILPSAWITNPRMIFGVISVGALFTWKCFIDWESDSND